MPKAHHNKVTSSRRESSSTRGAVFASTVASSSSHSLLLTPPASPERAVISKSNRDVPLYTPPPKKRRAVDTPDGSPLRLIWAGMPGSPTKRKAKQEENASDLSVVPRSLRPPMPSREELKAELVRCKPALVQSKCDVRLLVGVDRRADCLHMCSLYRPRSLACSRGDYATQRYDRTSGHACLLGTYATLADC